MICITKSGILFFTWKDSTIKTIATMLIIIAIISFVMDYTSFVWKFAEFIEAKLFAKRNFARQGKASAKPDGIVTYVEGDKSML